MVAAGPETAASGSSPVSARYAAGMCRRRDTPSFCRSTSQCAFTVRGEMPSWQPISSFEHPAAISSTTCRCRVCQRRRCRSREVASMAATLPPSRAPAYCPKGVFLGLRYAPTRAALPTNARLVPAPVRLGELVLVQRADAQQELELVAQVRPHHLRPVGRDRERDAVARRTRGTCRALRPRRAAPSSAGSTWGRSRARSRPRAARPSARASRGREDAVADPVGPQRLDHLADLGDAVLAALLADVDRHAEAGLARLVERAARGRA